jgi:hypothetical protein
MAQFYVTVEQTKSWNLTIEAENEVQAQEKAVEEIAFEQPDYIYSPEVTDCEEVKRAVNEW